MTWFRIDDRFHDHKKVRRLRRSCPDKRRDASPIGLWALAGSWSGLHHTGGFVPLEVLLDWDDDAEALAERLVAAKLWTLDEVDGEEGYRFHDWRDRNPGEDEDGASYSARGNHLRWHVRRKKIDPNCELCVSDSSGSSGANRGGYRGGVGGDIGGESGEESPRPDPTRPDPTTAANAAAAKATLPPPQRLVEELAAVGLTVRWDKLTQAEMEEIHRLHDQHGTARLVKSAKDEHRRDQPALHAKAWLPKWRQLLSVVPPQAREKCDMHRQQMPCSGCAADAKTGATA